MKKIYLLLFVALFSIGCDKDNDNEDDPQMPVTGRIAGEVRFTDEFGKELPVHSNMKVTALAGYYDITDGGGNFQVNNLTPGYYDLTYEKSGFGTFKKFNIGVAENATTTLSGIDSIGQQSTTIITNLNITFNTVDSTFDIGCNLSPLPGTNYPRSFRLFFSKSSAVSYINYLFSPSNTWVSITANGQISGYERQEFFNNGFNPGETVYAVAYGESMVTNSYTNPVTNKKVFPNLNSSTPSNTVQFILP